MFDIALNTPLHSVQDIYLRGTKSIERWNMKYKSWKFFYLVVFAHSRGHFCRHEGKRANLKTSVWRKQIMQIFQKMNVFYPLIRTRVSGGKKTHADWRPWDYFNKIPPDLEWFYPLLLKLQTMSLVKVYCQKMKFIYPSKEYTFKVEKQKSFLRKWGTQKQFHLSDFLKIS